MGRGSDNNAPRSRRSLTKEERVLWSSVTREMAPLRRPKPTPGVEPDLAPSAGNTAPVAPSGPAPAAAVRVPAKPAAPSPHSFDPRLKRRLARGNELIDDRVDLHGLTQAQAHAELTRFLRAAVGRGARIVLVITGKGIARNPGDERGVLRRQVPQWLRGAELRDYVVGFAAAHVGHGGDGALYVRLRRQRSKDRDR